MGELFFRNAPFQISELGYAMLQNRFPRVEITTSPSLAQARYGYDPKLRAGDGN